VDRIYHAILASALLLLVVATGLYVTRTAVNLLRTDGHL